MQISKKREGGIVIYLREYIELCKKHRMFVIGSIGADTALWEENDIIGDFELELKSKIGEIIYGGIGGVGLFCDDGDNIPQKKQLDKIYEKVWSG